MRKQTVIYQELQVKKDPKIFLKQLAFTLLITGAVIVLFWYRKAFKAMPLLLYFVLLPSALAMLKYIFALLSRSSLMVINHEGIQVKKAGLQPWKNVWYYYLAVKEKEKGPAETFFVFKLRNPEEEIRINTRNCNVTGDEILEFIEQVKGNSEVMKMDTLKIPEGNYF